MDELIRTEKIELPTLEDIQRAHNHLDDLILETPTWRWQTSEIVERVGRETQVFLKLELFQHTGTFKPRGALTVMRTLDEDQLTKGVTTVSAGNHAIAVAFASQLLGTTAKVVMPRSANAVRVNRCKAYGADVILVDDVQMAFARVHEIEAAEGRFFVHPFEGPLTVLGQATVGLEFGQQVADLDAIIVPVGGGGLIAGVGAAMKQLQPQCRVIGVEPMGADTMYRSLAAGEICAIDRVRTIADSLGAPYTTPYTFGVCQECVDEVVRVDDDELRAAMALMFRSLKFAVEPAGAAATAALCGPLRDRLQGHRVGIVVCGTNIDIGSFSDALALVETTVPV